MKTFRRILALVLILCTLSTLCPTFAETTLDGTQTVVSTDSFTGQLRDPEEIVSQSVGSLLADLDAGDATDKTVYDSGDWVYRLDENGWAYLNGCQNITAEKLRVPGELDGHPVAGLDAGVFSNASGLRIVTLPAGIFQIDDKAFEGLEEQLTIQGYHGTAALQFASERGLVTRSLSVLYFQEDVIDFTNVRKNAYQLSGSTVTFPGPEGRSLKKGCLFFLPSTEDAYRVESILKTSEGIVVETTTPEAQEVLTRIKGNFDHMTLDRDHLVFADGVEVLSVEERLSGSLDIDFLKFTLKIPTLKWPDDKLSGKNVFSSSFSFGATVSFGISFSGSVDLQLFPWELNEFSFIVTTNTSINASLAGKLSWVFPLGEIPLFSSIVKAGLTPKLSVSFEGSASWIVSSSEERGFEYIKDINKFRTINNCTKKKAPKLAIKALNVKLIFEIKLEAPIIDEMAKVTFEIGFQLAAEMSTNSVILREEGPIIEDDHHIYEQLDLETLEYFKNRCFDVTLSLCAGLKISITLPGMDWDWDLLNTSLKLGAPFHMELQGGSLVRVSECTFIDGSKKYFYITLDLNDGRAPEIISVPKNGYINQEWLDRTVENAPEGYSFAGWYTDAQFTTPYEKKRINEKITLYARWIKNAQILELHDKILGNRSLLLPANEPILSYISNENAVVQYIFQGWFLDQAYSHAVTTETIMPEETTHIYAKWKYDATYNPFEGAKSLALLTFERNNSGGYTVTSCKKGATAITIPDYYFSLPVTEIGNGCFQDCTRLRLVNVGGNVTSIANNAFKNCYDLNQVTLPNGVVSIGNSTFENCTNLKKLDLPVTITSLGTSVFRASGLTSLIIPDSVTRIGSSLFYNCTSLQTVSIPNNCISLPSSIFYGCSSLTQFQVPSGLQTVESSAFQGCAKLTSLILPESVTTIRSSAFRDCSALSDFALPSGLLTLGSSALQGCSSLTSISIPQKITSVPSYCFKNNTNLTQITLHSSITSLEKECFSFCSTLTLSTLPEALTTIGESAFYRCQSIQNLKIPETVTSIGVNAFRESGLTSISFPKAILSVPGAVVQDCTALTRVELHDGITAIEAQAFQGCSALETVELPASVVSIGNNAFRNCTALSTLALNEGLTSLGSYFIANTPKLTVLTLPSTATSLRSNAFNDIYVHTLTLPEGIVSLSGWMFENAKCTYINLPKTLTAIGTQCFIHCEHLASMFLPYGIKEIPSWAFGFCSSLSEIWIPPTITSFSKNAFYLDYFQKVGNVTVYGEADTAADTIASTYGWIRKDYTYEVPNTSVVQRGSSSGFEYSIIDESAIITGYTGDETGTLVIPSVLDGYPVIGLSMYSLPGQYTSVSIPASITVIEPAAFAGATQLKSFTLQDENTVFSIVSSVLYEKIDSGFRVVAYPQARTNTSFTLPSNVTEIGPFAFQGARNLKSISLSSVSLIDEMAFNGCASLMSLKIPKTVTEIANSAFGDCDLVLYCDDNTGITAQYARDHSIGFNLYTVHLNFEGEMISEFQVQYEALLEEAVLPAQDFKSFDGWYKDSSKKKLWNFASDTMPASDLTLYGFWSSDFSIATSADHVIITGYQGVKSDVVIPEEIGGLPVTEIASNVLISSEELSFGTVTIPSTVTVIANDAFSGIQAICGDAGSAAETFASHHALTFLLREYTLSFDCGIGSPIQPLLYHAGDTITIPETIWDNHQLCGWYLDSSYEEEWLATTMPAGNIRLYALWQRVDGASQTDVFQLSYTENGAVIALYTGNLPEVVIPSVLNGYTVIGIGDHAFQGCNTLQTLTVPDTIRSIGAYAFSNSSLAEIHMGDSITTIGEYAFYDCTKLTSFPVLNEITIIPKGMMARCTNLRTMTLGSKVKNIGESAFSEMIRLNTLNLNEGLEHIGDDAFSCCTALTDIFIPSTTNSLGKGVFAGCSSLRSWSLINNAFYQVQGPALLTIDGADLIAYAIGYPSASFVVPSTVTSIMDGAFMDCSALQKVELPERLLKIGENAFRNTGISLICISHFVQSIADTAFADCASLAIMGEAGSYAEDYAKLQGIPFYTSIDSIKAKQLSLPAVISLSAGCYTQIKPQLLPTEANVQPLNWLSANSDIASVDSNGMLIALQQGTTFITVRTTDGSNLTAQCLVIVDGELKIMKAPTQLERIEKEAFFSSPMEALDLRSTSCVSIGSRAFASCNNLRLLLLPDTLHSIAVDAFENTPSLVFVVHQNSYVKQYASEHGIPCIVQ